MAANRRDVAVLAGSLFGRALGEELWQAYMPAYLSALGAIGLVIGLFSSLKDLLDSAYQYPGGLAGTAVFAITSLRARAEQSPERSAPVSR